MARNSETGFRRDGRPTNSVLPHASSGGCLRHSGESRKGIQPSLLDPRFRRRDGVRHRVCAKASRNLPAEINDSDPVRSTRAGFNYSAAPETLIRRVISAGEALSAWLPRGTSVPSTNTEHFDPRLVFPTLPCPFFAGKKLTSNNTSYQSVLPPMNRSFAAANSHKAGFQRT